MATTSKPVTELAIGLRDSSGAALSSAKVRFYNVGTTVQATVYSDDACTTAYAQPITCNSGGQATVFTLEPVRMVAKDSTDVTTWYDGNVNLSRHDAVMITHTSINSGTETTLENMLTTATTSLGANFQKKESSTATAVNWNDTVSNMMISVMEYGALGDDTQDDTTYIQATIDRVEARGGGIVFFPEATYKITAVLTVDAAKVCLMGVGRGASVIKNHGTTTNAIAVNLGSAVDSKLFIRNLGITANTTSSGAGITVTNGDRIAIENCSVALHRTGITTSAVSAARIENCLIESTDDNAAALGIVAGARGRIMDCEVISGTDNGTGITLGADARAIDCYVSNFATGLVGSGVVALARGLHVNGSTTGATMSGNDSQLVGGYITSVTTGVTLSGTRAVCDGMVIGTVTTGVSMTAAGTTAKHNVISSATTAISVGAVANCQVYGNTAAGNTTDLSVNASATLLREFDNTFTNVTNSAATSAIAPRKSISRTTDATATPSWTPVLTAHTVQILVCSYTAGDITVTVNAATTTNASPGDVLELTLWKLSGNSLDLNVTFDTNYKFADGSTAMTYQNAGATANKHSVTFLFRWDGTVMTHIGGGATYPG